MKASHDYGLELTNNSKVSWAFSLPREKTCISATEICRRVCYGGSFRYQSPGHKAKRERNLRTVELLLTSGGPDLLAENLLSIIDQVRPADWLAASITGTDTKTPWTLRIHDVGDFHSVPYVKAWVIAAQKRPQCSFWFYTRSFADATIYDALSQLAALPNCQGWLSIDSDNFESGLLAYAMKPGIWKLALLQEDYADLDGDILPALEQQAQSKEVVSFPVHRGGRHVKPIEHKSLFTCPAVIGIYKLESNARKLRPCQSCTFCLPRSCNAKRPLKRSKFWPIGTYVLTH